MLLDYLLQMDILANAEKKKAGLSPLELSNICFILMSMVP